MRLPGKMAAMKQAHSLHRLSLQLQKYCAQVSLQREMEKDICLERNYRRGRHDTKKERRGQERWRLGMDNREILGMEIQWMNEVWSDGKIERKEGDKEKRGREKVKKRDRVQRDLKKTQRGALSLMYQMDSINVIIINDLLSTSICWDRKHNNITLSSTMLLCRQGFQLILHNEKQKSSYVRMCIHSLVQGSTKPLLENFLMADRENPCVNYCKHEQNL